VLVGMSDAPEQVREGGEVSCTLRREVIQRVERVAKRRELLFLRSINTQPGAKRLQGYLHNRIPTTPAIVYSRHDMLTAVLNETARLAHSPPASGHVTAPLTRVASVGSACAAIAMTVWLAPASVHIDSWPTSGPERVAYVAPLGEFLWAVALAIIAFAAAVLIARRAGDRDLEVAARLLSPLQWLWLWTVPFWPVVPDRLPLLLVFAGPVRWMLAAAVAGMMVIRLARARRLVPPTPRVGRPAIFTISLAIYLLAAFNWHAILGLTGDEPHFLVITHSLLVDRDLDISNNYERGDYRTFFASDLRPDYLTRGKHGEIYGNHPAGLPALLVPAYAIAGATGAMLFMAVVAALTAVAIFDIATLSGGSAVALLTWAAVCLSVPFMPHAWQLLTEVPAALIVAWTVLWLIEPPPDRAAAWVGRGAALALLPWLHTRYSTLMAPLAVFLVLVLMRRLRRVALVGALATPLAISLAFWFWSFYVMYGVFDPQAPYGSYADTFVRNSNIARGVSGLLLDPKFGLLMFAPVYAFAAGGALAMWRRNDRWLLAALVGTAALYVASTTRQYIWWGGSSAGARFLVPTLPLLVPLVALAAATLRQSAAALLRAAVVVGLSIAAFGFVSPLRFLLSDAHGQSVLLTELQGSAPLARVWPTWTEPPPWAPQLTRFARALAGRFDAPTRAATVRAGREALLEEYDPARLRPLDYARRGRNGAAAVIERASLEVRRGAGELNEDARHLAGPFVLPAGVFTIRIWFSGTRPLSAPAFVSYHRGPALVATDTVSGGVATMHLATAVPAPIVWVGVGDADAARVERVEIQPETIVPQRERPQFEPIAIEPLERQGSLLAYADRNSWPEGGVFWTRSTRTAVVYIAPAGASQATFTVHTGPNAGIVRVEVGPERHEANVPRDGVVDLVVPLPRGVEAVPVRISASTSFIPAAVDPHSNDQRSLGCQVRIRLS